MGNKGLRVTRADDGAAAVEFALVSVLLLTLLFGILQYGFYFFELQSANAASREAARLAATGIGTGKCPEFRDAVNARTSGVTLTSITTAVTPAPLPPSTTGEVVTVTVRFVPSKFGFPFVPFISGSQDEVASARVESPGSVTTCT